MNKKINSLIYFTILFSVIYLGCTGGRSCQNNGSYFYLCKNYNFTMTDSLDNKLVEGVLHINDFEGDKINGTYKFIKVYNDSFPGYSSMKGKFKGTANDKTNKIFINTNPSLSDYNVLLNLSVKNDTLTGTWNLSTMKGIMNYGNFFATKIKK